MEKNILEVKEVVIVRTKSTTVRARADILFQGFWVKGFKVMQDDTGKEFVTAPSYRAGQFWRALFKTERKKDWQEICHQVLKKYNSWSLKESVSEIFEEKDN